MSEKQGNKAWIQEEEISLKDLIISVKVWIKYLFSKWYILLIAGLIGGILGFFYAKSKKPIYIATTTFVLESGDRGGGGLGQYAGMAAMMGVNLGGGGLFQGDNIFELYKSRSMLEKTLLAKVDSISDELLIERYIGFNKLKEAWVKRPELLAVDFKEDVTKLDAGKRRLRDSLITVFSNTINERVLKVGKSDKKLSIIQVDVMSEDEIFSKSFNENLVKHVNEFYISTKTGRSLSNINILQEKVDSVRRVMSGAISDAAYVVDATPNLNPTKQAQRIVPSQKAQFSAETNKAILGQLVQNLELAKMTLLQEQPLIQIVDLPIYPLKEDRSGKAKGGIIGGCLFGFLTLLGLIIVRFYKSVMQS